MGAWSVNLYLWCLNLERTRNWVKAVLVAIFTILTSEVHLEECKWSVFWTLCARSTACPRHDTPGLVFKRNCQLQWPTVVFHSAVLSARHGPHSKVWLCRCWQGDDWCCSSHVVPVNSPSLLLPEPDRRMIEGVGVICRRRKEGGGSVCSLLYPFKTPQGWLPLSHVLASKHRQNRAQFTFHIWDQ